MGRIEEIADPEDRYRHIAADYLQDWLDDEEIACWSCQPDARRSRERSRRRSARSCGTPGGWGQKDREFTRLVQVDSTEAERGQATTYRPGDVIQFHQNAKGGFTKGERLTVTDPAAVPLSEAAKFSLYRPEAIALAEGDRIRFTGTVKTLDGEHTLKNGMAHTVAGFTARGIKLENGWVIPNDAGHFRHGFVETSFGSQGRTVQRVILGMPVAAIPAMNMEQLYVSASRAKEWIRLYTDDKAEIRDAVKRSSLKLAALDLPRQQEPLFKPSDGLSVTWNAGGGCRWSTGCGRRGTGLPGSGKSRRKSKRKGRRTMATDDDALLRAAGAAQIDPPRNEAGDGPADRPWNRRKMPKRYRRQRNDFASLPQPGSPYDAAHSRADNKPVPTLRFVMGDTIRGFPYANYDSIDWLAPDKPGASPAIVIRFTGLVAREAIIAGRHLLKLYDLLSHHRVAWVRELPKGKDFGDKGHTVITSITINRIKEIPA